MRIPRELVGEALQTAPASFVLTPRNPERRIHVGGNYISFGLVAALELGHRRAPLEALE